jgi:penicillin-binding protein 1C
VQFGPAGEARSALPLEAARSEWFLAGTQQPLFAINSEAPHAVSTRAGGQNGTKTWAESAARITAPAPGTILALDPDIPPGRQRVSFQAEGANLRWVLDGKPLARGNSVNWVPWPGRHRVQITNARGQVLDEIRLEVRGAGVRTASGAAGTTR